MREPPPPNVIDLGNGHVRCIGTAADFRAAAAWLRRNYPQHSDDPPSGDLDPVIYNMGYELTREARAGMPRGWSMGQRALVLLLADICNDRTRRQPSHMDVSERLCEELDITPGALGNILSRLAAAGFEFRVVVGKDKRGRPLFAHRGHAVDYQFPAIPPRTTKGPSVDGPKAVDNSLKGPSVDGPKAPEGPLADGASGRKVHPSMVNGPSVDGPQTTKTPTGQKMTPGRVGDPIADSSAKGQDQDQRQEQPIANSLPRVHDGPDNGLIELNGGPLHDAESATAGSYARASESNALANGHGDLAESTPGNPGADAPCPNPPAAASDATTTPAVDPDEHRASELARLEAWIAEHPETVTQ